MITGLDHVQVAAPPGAERAARRFYGELLGLAEVVKPAALQARGGVWFQIGAQELHVGTSEAFAPALKAHPGLTVSAAGLADLAERLAAAGHAVTWDETIPTIRRFFTADPWGNRLELLARG